MAAGTEAPPALVDEAEARALVEQALAASAASETEVTLHQQIEATTRFAADGITQNVLSTDGSVSVRAVFGQRTGRASTTSFTEVAIRRAVERAVAAARIATEDHETLPLPGPATYAPLPDRFDPGALEQTPLARAEAVRAAAERVRAQGLRPAGTYVAGGERQVIANSRGLFAAWQGSSAGFALTALGDDSSGWAERLAHGPSGLDVEAATAVAIGKALASRAPSALDPGDYPVVLEPAAVTDFLMFLGHLGFSGLAFNEGRSFLSGKLGETLFSPLVSIADDVFDPLADGPPFDAEGVARRAVTLVERGRAAAVVHDRRTARIAGVESTGHALPQPSTWGPVAQNLRMAAGDATLEQLIAAVPRGVLVSRFHYTNVLDPLALTLTGMTRDGTFLIEDGKVTRPLKNLRFTQSAPELLGGVEAVGRECLVHRALFGGSFVVPALRVRSFHFSSGTGF